MSRDTSTGIKFEKQTDLIDYLIRAKGYKSIGLDVYRKEDGHELLNLKGRKLYSKLSKLGINYKEIISRQLIPDECVFSKSTKTLYVFEKKFQQTQGSADEKLQTCDFKRKQYQKLVSSLGWEVRYVYILSDWFKQPMYKDVLEYIVSVGCGYRFVDNFYTYLIQ